MTLRAMLRAKSDEAKGKGDVFYLVHWGEEETVSIHSDTEITAKEKRVGAFCEVPFGKQGRKYTGRIACIGSKAEMISQEKRYLKGEFTPFELSNGTNEDAATLPTSPQDTVTKKRKRKLINGKKGSQGKSNAEHTSKKMKENTKNKRGTIISIGNAATSESESELNAELDVLEEPSLLQRIEKKKQLEDRKKFSDSKSNLSETLEDSDRKKQIEKGKEMPDETDPCQTAREESQPVKEKMNDDNWQNYIDELSNHQNDNYIMEVARRSHNSRGPSYSELKNRVEQLELSVAKLIGYPSDVLSRMRHVFTTRYNPYSLQGSHQLAPLEYSPSPEYSSSPSPLGYYSPNPSQLEYNHNLNDSLSSLTPSSPAISPSEYRRSEPLVDLTNSRDSNMRPATSHDELPTTSDEMSSSNRSLLETYIAVKKSNPLPPIDKSNLSKPEDVVEKYSRFLTVSKIPTLAVRLSKECYFGKTIMARCTVRGAHKFHALPEKELKSMKSFLMKLCVPRYTPSQVEFEMVWKNCTESIGQACKALRRQGDLLEN